MTSAASPTSLFSPHAQRVGWVVGIVWFAWLLVGIFPVTPLEGDEQGVLHGATSLATGDTHYWGLSYLYEIQPGSYVAISRLSRLTGWPTQAVFATLSSGGALLFAAGGALLVQRLLQAPWLVVVAGFLLSQEIWAGAYYMNSTTVGAWLAMLALLLALKPLTLRRGIFVAALLAIAGWIRVDCLLLSPVVPALSWWRTRGLRSVAREILPVALVALLLVVLLYLSSGVRWAAFLAAYAERGGNEGWGPTFRMYCVVTSALVGVLSAVGVVLMALRRQGALLLLWMAGIGLSFAVYGRSLASNKYLYLATPFFVLAAVYAVQAVLARWPGWGRLTRWTVAGIAATLFLFDTMVGVLTSTPANRRFEPRPQLAVLATIPHGGRTLQFTLGAGELLATTDGYRMRGGTLFAPATWSMDKADVIRRLDELARNLRADGDASLFVGDWLGYQLTTRVLRQEGFEFVGKPPLEKSYPYAGTWRNGTKVVHLDFLAYAGSEYYDSHRVTPNPTGHRTWFVGALGTLGPLGELNDGLRWSPDPYGFIRVHSRH